MSTYRDACDKAGKIVIYAERQHPAFPQACDDFEQLYWGDMSLVEDSLIVETAKSFRLGYRDFQASDHDMENVNKLKRLAADFTTACKQASVTGWHEIIIKYLSRR